MIGIRRRRGFSMIELIVAAGISMGFAYMLSLSLASTSEVARDTLAKASIADDTRQLADTASRYLRGAVPPGTCEQPVGVARTSLCERVGTGPSAFEAASSSRAVFYTYGSAGADATGEAKVPDKVEISLNGTVMTIQRYPATSTEYVAPSWSPTPQVVRVVDAEGSTAAFKFYNASGTQLSDATLATAAGLRQIALVEFTPRVSLTVGGENFASELKVFAAVGGETS